jgi:hypothetical protein
MRGMLAGMMMLAGAARAEGWQVLDGPAIRAALEMKDLRFPDGTEQLFFLGGITRFSHGWPNEGRWKVVGDQYCSQWPPARDWACYAVWSSAATGRVRFEGADHRVTEGTVMGEAKWP